MESMTKVGEAKLAELAAEKDKLEADFKDTFEQEEENKKATKANEAEFEKYFNQDEEVKETMAEVWRSFEEKNNAHEELSVSLKW